MYYYFLQDTVDKKSRICLQSEHQFTTLCTFRVLTAGKDYHIVSYPTGLIQYFAVSGNGEEPPVHHTFIVTEISAEQADGWYKHTAEVLKFNRAPLVFVPDTSQEDRQTFLMMTATIAAGYRSSPDGCRLAPMEMAAAALYDARAIIRQIDEKPGSKA